MAYIYNIPGVSPVVLTSLTVEEFPGAFPINTTESSLEWVWLGPLFPNPPCIRNRSESSIEAWPYLKKKID